MKENTKTLTLYYAYAVRVYFLDIASAELANLFQEKSLNLNPVTI